MIKKITLFLLTFLSVVVNAQENTSPKMADNMRAEGKIYVVIAVMAIIFACVAVYLFLLDRKVKKLEEELKNKK